MKKKRGIQLWHLSLLVWVVVIWDAKRGGKIWETIYEVFCKSEGRVRRGD